MATQDVLEMAYPKRYVEHIITGLEDPLNQHLVKLVGFDFEPELREHFRQECEAWLDNIQRLPIKPQPAQRIGNRRQCPMRKTETAIVFDPRPRLRRHAGRQS